MARLCLRDHGKIGAANPRFFEATSIITIAIRNAIIGLPFNVVSLPDTGGTPIAAMEKSAESAIPNANP